MENGSVPYVNTILVLDGLLLYKYVGNEYLFEYASDSLRDLGNTWFFLVIDLFLFIMGLAGLLSLNNDFINQAFVSSFIRLSYWIEQYGQVMFKFVLSGNIPLGWDVQEDEAEYMIVKSQ